MCDLRQARMVGLINVAFHLLGNCGNNKAAYIMVGKKRTRSNITMDWMMAKDMYLTEA